jgi:cation transport protein ChaC
MPYASYRPEWLSCRLDDGSRVRALGFVLERHLPSYAGSLPDSIVQRVFASAQGHFGSTRDYVEQTVNATRLRHARSQPGSLAGALLRQVPD